MPPAASITRSFGALNRLPSNSPASTRFSLVATFHATSWPPMLQATSSPSRLNISPLQGPLSSTKTAVSPAALTVWMRAFGMSVKYSRALPSHAGPSVKPKPVATFTTSPAGPMFGIGSAAAAARDAATTNHAVKTRYRRSGFVQKLDGGRRLRRRSWVESQPIVVSKSHIAVRDRSHQDFCAKHRRSPPALRFAWRISPPSFLSQEFRSPLLSAPMSFPFCRVGRNLRDPPIPSALHLSSPIVAGPRPNVKALS